MRRIAGLSRKQPMKKPAVKVRKAPPKAGSKSAPKGTSQGTTKSTSHGSASKPAEATEHRHAPQRYAFQFIDVCFKDIDRDDLIITKRQFPAHMRADLQPAFDELFVADADYMVGALPRYHFEKLTFSSLLQRDSREAVPIGPLQYADVDIGEDEPAECLENALVFKDGAVPHAVFLIHSREHGDVPFMSVEIAVPRDRKGAYEFVQGCFRRLEQAIAQSRAYRGKVLSLERAEHYSGRSRGILVHRIPRVEPDAVILPDATRKLLDRNVIDFMKARDSLRALGLQTKKGILLYGPPGTGKTHTIRYLASNLPGVTTLIITAEQVGLLDSYMRLARLLQPSMVVIEDVDLIARAREEMRGGCEEVLLNRLLNEMDGLQENADVLFVLTTNRPQDLEAALAQRPGRIDQAIEVPLPDETCREKLVRLYSRGLKLSSALVAQAAQRTEGVSAAFIKELMRRTAQAAMARTGTNGTAKKAVEPNEADLGEALDDMLFSGGQLNVRLLGGASA
jgi:AAA+ superfamily predicted ATPase